MRVCNLLAFLVCFAVGPGSLRADVLYSSFGPGDSFMGTGVQFIGLVEWLSPIRTDVRVANQFTVGSPATVSQYRVAISLRTGMSQATQTGYLSLWSGAAEPATLVEDDILFDTGGPSPGLSFIAAIDSVTHPVLTPGETYWVLLRAGIGELDSYRWYDADPATGLTRLVSWTGADWLSAGTQGNAFDVRGTLNAVPEPSAWLLLGAAFSLLALPGMRRIRG